MILTGDDFIKSGSVYYSPGIRPDINGQVVIGVESVGIITGSLQKSINGINWDTVDNSDFEGSKYKELNIYDIHKSQQIRLVLNQKPTSVYLS